MLGLLNRLIRYPELITCPASAGELPPEAKKLRRELDELLCRPPVDEIQAKSLAFRLSSLQLDAIGPEKYETLRLRRMFQGRVPMAELEQELLHESVRRITVSLSLIHIWNSSAPQSWRRNGSWRPRRIRRSSRPRS